MHGIDKYVTEDQKWVAMPKKEHAAPTDSSNEDDVLVAEKKRLHAPKWRRSLETLLKFKLEWSRRLVINEHASREAWKELKKRHVVSKNNVDFAKFDNEWSMFIIKDALMDLNKVFAELEENSMKLR